ncbi:MAG: spore maturation protein [Lentimicrobium sp.]|jgi:spore maturation protein SpmA|uniref:nucleoside recognition domain-containing protein n=2 Tax=Lentimicrobium sp. TaxID=2034841 RepID=UPI0025E62DBB|nr:spore maturation protein [Lentimicrobium sp.]MCO5257279.1 spore maturation protein [Lentimicrobium sp.]MCO5263011.1 spore maturation protein [Lentimicrobium sp.]HOP13076.1 nucleoside recognition domain-containing protein [Lentimicrobium sp.]HPF65271.1 nucleoside recognition domain-containing protein [Lentimicrobium sp.]HPJ62829.1 nucleoside recognition domain-containing protein [Lentimicrobium sp.]
MVLNYIWVAFFIIAFIVGLFRLIFMGDVSIFPEMMNSTFDMARTGFEISLGLTGVMTLWMGLMKVGESGGIVNLMSKAVGPLFSRLFPEIPKGHPASGSIMMNIAANLLGLDNAATPLGLKAMTQLQELNKDKDTASNAMIMFLVLNASGLTLIPVSIMVYRAQLGAADPSDVFIPILLATFCSTLTGIIAVSAFQKINLFNRVILAYLGGFTLLIASIIWYFSTISQEQVTVISSVAGNLILFGIIFSFIILGLFKRINVYESFIEGAKEGFSISIRIIPYLVAILVAVGVFRTCGAMDFLVQGIGSGFAALGMNTDFVDALPTAFMKPLSGSGARGMMVDTMKQYGADSFAGRLSCVFQGAADTTFYIVAVYFGSVGIKKTRYAITAGLLADLAGVIAAIFVAYLFFH